ncbi:cell division protein SepF [Cyanobium sp. Morenito 9A2]|uniref:cell division protein SepF n=1 Tax=Cyanobium sp. Morenito 9A2 TaxID=2823718 RepID=UPI0037C0B4FB
MTRFADGGHEVVLMQPRRFEEVSEAVLAVRDRKTVLLNLSAMEHSEAQRAADFVAGGVFAIDGHQEQLDDLIFLFAPYDVAIERDPF